MAGASFARDAEAGRLAAADLSDDELEELRGVSGADYLPSPAEIEAGCQAIRATWTEAQRVQRATGPTFQAWLPPHWLGRESDAIEGVSRGV